MQTKPHDVDWMMARIAEAVQGFPKAALFELAEEGFTSPFEQLVACIISIRTLDEVLRAASPARSTSRDRANGAKRQCLAPSHRSLLRRG